MNTEFPIGTLKAISKNKKRNPLMKHKSTSEGWEDRFDLEMMGSLVVHVYETKQFEDIKKFIAKEIKITKRKTLEEIKKGILEQCLKCNEFKKEVNPIGICIPCCKKIQKKYGIEEEKEL